MARSSTGDDHSRSSRGSASSMNSKNTNTAALVAATGSVNTGKKVSSKQAKAEAKRRRSLKETYTQALIVAASDQKPVSDFMTGFRLHEEHYENEFQKQLKGNKYPPMLGHYQELVEESKSVTHKAFLQRYLFRCCDLDRIKIEIAEQEANQQSHHQQQQHQIDATDETTTTHQPQEEGEEEETETHGLHTSERLRHKRVSSASAPDTFTSPDRRQGRKPTVSLSSNDLLRNAAATTTTTTTRASHPTIHNGPKQSILRKANSGNINVRFRGDVYQEDVSNQQRRAAWEESTVHQQTKRREDFVAPPAPCQRQETVDQHSQHSWMEPQLQFQREGYESPQKQSQRQQQQQSFQPTNPTFVLKSALRKSGQAGNDSPSQPVTYRSSMNRTSSMPSMTKLFRKESNSVHTKKRWDSNSNHSPVQGKARRPMRMPRRQESRAAGSDFVIGSDEESSSSEDSARGSFGSQSKDSDDDDDDDDEDEISFEARRRSTTRQATEVFQQSMSSLLYDDSPRTERIYIQQTSILKSSNHGRNSNHSRNGEAPPRRSQRPPRKQKSAPLAPLLNGRKSSQTLKSDRQQKSAAHNEKSDATDVGPTNPTTMVRERLKRWNSNMITKGTVDSTVDKSPLKMMQRSYSMRNPIQQRKQNGGLAPKPPSRTVDQRADQLPTTPQRPSSPRRRSRPTRSKSAFDLAIPNTNISTLPIPAMPKRTESPSVQARKRGGKSPSPAKRSTSPSSPLPPRPAARSVSPTGSANTRSTSPTPSLVSISTATTTATGITTVVMNNLDATKDRNSPNSKRSRPKKVKGNRWQKFNVDSPVQASPQDEAKIRRPPLLPTRSTDDLPLFTSKDLDSKSERKKADKSKQSKKKSKTTHDGTKSKKDVKTLGVRSVEEASRLRNEESTYNTNLSYGPGESSKEELFSYQQDFDLLLWQDQAQIALAMYPDSLARRFLDLVPKKVSLEEFWKRYFWRCDELRILRNLRNLEAKESS